MKRRTRWSHFIIPALVLFPIQVVDAQNVQEALFKAVKNNDVLATRKILGRKVNVNAADGEGITPLHWSAGNSQIARLLLAQGANPNAKTQDGLTPLHWAVAKGKKDVVEALMAFKADVNARDENGDTPLHWAADRSQTGIAEMLVRKGADVNAKNNDRLTPLQVAAYKGFQQIVDLLLKYGAQSPEIALLEAISRNDLPRVKALIGKGTRPDAPAGIYRSTPLHWAALQGRQAIVEYMTQSKVDINVKDEAESTPLHWAVKGGSLDIVRTIIGKGADIAGVAERPGTAIYYDGAGTVTWQTRRIETIDGTPLHWAAHTGRADIAEFLISKGADVNATTAYRWTPIYFAAREQHEDLVELLMARGAVVNMNDDTFGSPMHAAGSRRIAELLQNSGASTNAKCTYYGSPLHMAAYEGRAEVVQFLLEKGLNVDELARWQLDVTDITAPVTPPYVAALGGQLEVVKLLMAKGADVNFVSAKLVIRNTSTGKDEEADFGCGGGVLHAAAWGGHVGVCEYLLHKGAQIDQKGDMPSGTPFSLPRRKVTPLSVAAQRGHLSVVKLLLEKGASANAKDESGHTAYYWAASDEIKDVLRKHGAKSDKPQQGRKGAS